ncbi:LacI family DNA-binding transcriptional regulator [Microbacterium sp. NPDC089696]|uniref:LacI family DNA-binding transcriptional regulator n=1 Tax=Microbacterium sp. NPDC089696 TaxID=3364199 RepID=UPI0038194937
MEKRTTSHDVAHLAGVSQSTVSFVLTGRPGISEATRDRVLRAAAELNYRPNLAARSMRTRRSGRLAVVVPIATLHPLTLLSGAIAAARDEGYAVEVVSLPDDPSERDERLAELVDAGAYEGILSFSPLPLVTEDAGAVVLAAGEMDDEMHMSGVLADAQPIVEMIEHLAAHGHRRFLHVAGPQDFPSARARQTAYLQTVDRLGVESLGVTGGAWSGEAGEDAVAALPDDATPLAVIAANDVIAAGVIRAATLRGWRMPEDLSVTGWDDLHQSAFLVPALTTVAQDRERLGGYAMLRLIAAVRGTDAPARPTDLLSVVWRESTA